MKNKLLKHTGAMLLLLACCLTSCIKEDGFTPTDKASVTLTFTTRAPGDDADPNAVLKGEGMKNLRVIVVDQASKEIRFNRTFPVPDNATSHTVRFGDLYAGRTYDFYAIANEASFSGDFSTYVEGEDLADENDLLNYQITANANTLIAEGIPAAGKEDLTVSGNENQSLTITMQRAVAKAKVTFVNETGAEQTITDVKLVKVGAANTVLFPMNDEMNYTPNDKGTVDLDLGDVTVAAAQNSEASTDAGYFYESQAPDEGYTLQATWNGNTKVFSLVSDMVGGSSLQSAILRNKFLNITITLKANDWKLDYEILPWNDHEVSIDFTDILSYTSAGWVGGTYLNWQGNTVWMNPDRPAELKFTINTPNGALWRATLEGDVNAFEFVDGINSGNAYYEEGETPVEQTIRLRVTDPESDARHEATLRVFADIGGKTYELDLTNPGQKVEGGSEVINHFTLLQSR